MGRKQNINQVILTSEQVIYLNGLTSKGQAKARLIKRANILLLSHQGISDKEICKIVKVSNPTMKRIRKAFVESGMELALYDLPRTGRPPKISGEARAKLTSLACTEAPPGHAKWTLQLLADHAVKLGIVDSLVPSTVFYILKKMSSRRTVKGTGVSPG